MDLLEEIGEEDEGEYSIPTDPPCDYYREVAFDEEELEGMKHA